MNVVWIAGAIAVVGVLAKWISWSHVRSRSGRADMGFVSQHWVAEHRLSKSQESQR